jgi:hypothetical protein
MAAAADRTDVADRHRRRLGLHRPGPPFLQRGLRSLRLDATYATSAGVYWVVARSRRHPSHIFSVSTCHSRSPRRAGLAGGPLTQTPEPVQSASASPRRSGRGVLAGVAPTLTRLEDGCRPRST